MKRLNTTISSSALALCVLLVGIACSRRATDSTPSSTEKYHASADVVLLSKGNDTTMVAVRFLEERVKNDPDDFVALNKLAGYYLQLHRETDDVKYLELSLRSAQASLNVLPIDQNLGGLSALALAEFETHNFASARDHAKELIDYKSQSSFGYQLFGDASLELGDYDRAAEAYRQMERLSRGSVATETRWAHFDLLHGDVAMARRRYKLALDLAEKESIPSAETVAWCNWQLGEVNFGSGDMVAAESDYQNALLVFPDYPHALSSLARLRVAQGNLPDAISLYEKVVNKRNDPVDCAALGDVYKLAGREQDAQKQYSTVEKVSLMGPLNTVLYNRHLVLFWADHDLNVAESYAKAKQEYSVRRDVYAADALAWTALKAGKVTEARTAIKDALRLGTQDARLFYHAGMIERAAGDTTASREYLLRALKLNPHFDPLQFLIAKRALNQ
jgi:tetratricopeptide (TPR) repeat protein